MTEAQGTGTRPRSILIVDDRRYREISQSPQYVDLLQDPESAVVPYSVRPESNEIQVIAIREMLLQAGQLVSGALLIKNPYEDEVYAFADSALEIFASAKYHHLANVARLLGAKEVDFIEAKVERETNRVQAALKAIIPGLGGGEVDVANEVAKKLDERLQGEMRFTGADAAIDDALGYIRDHYLSNDHQLQALVDMRRGENSLQHYKMSLSATRESDANFKCAARVSSKVPAKAINIGATFANNAESFRNIEITTEISF